MRKQAAADEIDGEAVPEALLGREAVWDDAIAFGAKHGFGTRRPRCWRQPARSG